MAYDGYRTFTLTLTGGVDITRDYSTVHDLTPAKWLEKLASYGSLYSGQVNWYRVPSPLRVEMPYDDARKVCYGYLTDSGWNDDVSTEGMTFKRPYFFWVDSVRLIRQGSEQGHLAGTSVYYENDVVEFTISPDIWSNCSGRWTLHDSQVVRKHMPRWDVTDSSGTYSYSPKYYADAGIGTDGAYEPFYDAELTPSSATLVNHQLTMFIVTAIDSDGVMKRYIGGDVLVFGSANSELPTRRKRILYDYDVGTSTPTYMLSVDDIIDGTFYTATGLSAEYVQSIIVYPYLNELVDALYEYTPPGVIGAVGFRFDTSDDAFSDWFAFGSETHDGTTLWFIKAKDADPINIMQPYDTTLSADPDGIPFPKPAKASSSGPYTTLQPYSDAWEPMLYRSPCMIRKFTDSVGGTVADIPDILAFENGIRLQNMIEVNGSVTYVYPGDDIRVAAQYGALGEAGAATLPIYNSAWQSYEAISKVGDEIKYNAAQVNTIGGGIANTILSAAGGFLMMGGPMGAALGAGGGITSTVTSAYANEENLKAKQTTIRNSPCTVNSSGSGIAVYVQGKVDLYYSALILDGESLKRMALDYYRKGYSLDRFFSGDIDLHTRYLFDYIQTSRAKVRGSVNAEEASAIAGILDAGTTIWHEDGWAYIRDNTASSGLPKYENMEIDS